MYHPNVIELEQHELEKRVGTKLTRYSPEYCWDVQAHLDSLWTADKGLVRPLTKEESSFITNERLLCSLDFTYWLRYAWVLPDAAVSEGTLVRFVPWPSQQILLDEIARLEWEQYQQNKRGEPQDGICIVGPKARQEGESELAGKLKMHRLTTTPFVRAITATENEDKRISLWERDERTWKALPWWLKPERTAPDLQGVRTTFGKLDSSVLYEDYMQESSLAAGEQYLLGHMSEVAQGDQTYVEKLMELDYFPAIPYSWRSLHILESTPSGMGGWWHPFVLAAYNKRAAYPRWHVKFIPYYAVTFKYRRVPPPQWIPSQDALAHAAKVEETSTEYMGKLVKLTKEQLYWWETTRQSYKEKNSLVYFLTNYPATLEESFQFSSTTIFDVETVEFYRTMARDPGGSYTIGETSDAERVESITTF